MGIKQTEETAIKLVLKYLKKKGIKGKRVNRKGYDIHTPYKKIEIKARRKRSRIFGLNYSNINAFNKNSNIELWAVIGVGTKNPELIKINKKTLLERKRIRKYWIFGLKNAELEKAIKL